jgi:hypothetical protein
MSNSRYPRKIDTQVRKSRRLNYVASSKTNQALLNDNDEGQAIQ